MYRFYKEYNVFLSTFTEQLMHILKEHGSKLSPVLKELFEELSGSAGSLALKMLDQANAAIPDPSQRYGGEVMKNFSTTASLSNNKLQWKPFEVIARHFSEFDKIGHEMEVVYPYLDFHCMVTLVENCNVPHVCEKMYLRQPYSQYMLMRQILYQKFARSRDCIESNQVAFGNSDEFVDRLCSKAYLEAEYLEKNQFPTRFIDLFAEQVGFCGVMGYSNFMRADWLREVLSWYTGSESGCVPDVYGEKKTTDAEVFVNTKNGGQESCLVHLTSVSLSALAVNLRYLFDSCSPNILKKYQISAFV